MEIRTKLADAKEALQKCNLCTDHLYILFPNKPEYWFFDYEDEMLEFMSDIESNINAHGGYMIDEWQFVDADQNLMDVRAIVTLELE